MCIENSLEILMSLLQVTFIKFNLFEMHKISKINMINVDSLTPIFWMENIKCYELKQVMRQSDEQFINILNQFRTTTQWQFVIDTINSQCFCTPPKDPNFPYLFYTNDSRLKHNESTFLRSDGDVYIFRVEDKHHDTCPKSFVKWFKFHSQITVKILSKEKHVDQTLCW